MGIFGFHLHAFPDRLAQRALESLSQAGGGMQPCLDGTLAGLRAWVGKPVYLDTAFSHSRVLIKQVDRIIRNHGADRILFGSDAPWSRPALESGLIRHLDIPASDLQAILEGNARRLLGLPAASNLDTRQGRT